MKVENVDKVLEKLRQLASQQFTSGKEAKGCSVIVGYTAKYALYVHEMVGWRHKSGKQAKYLEQPARAMRKQLARIVVDAMRRGVGLLQALYLAGLALQRASQKIVPVDTGNLKGSAFTRKEE